MNKNQHFPFLIFFFFPFSSCFLHLRPVIRCVTLGHMEEERCRARQKKTSLWQKGKKIKSEHKGNSCRFNYEVEKTPSFWPALRGPWFLPERKGTVVSSAWSGLSFRWLLYYMSRIGHEYSEMSNQAWVKPKEALPAEWKSWQNTFFSRKDIFCTIHSYFLLPFFLPVRKPGSPSQLRAHSERCTTWQPTETI